MIKVIIADDEPRICKLIEKLINWEELEMEVIKIASNGVEALEYIKEFNPDIVITDIRMPGYDGLEIIERTRKFNLDTEFIIISGYSEFEYAKKAINYKVNGYLLKPINKEELENALIEVKENILKKKTYENLESEYKDYLKKDVNAAKKHLDQMENKNINKNILQIEQAKEYINSNYMNNITLDDVGGYIGFNPSYFSSIFKKETGISFIDYLSRVRIEKAKILMKEADLRIQDISLMVGYNDVKYFSKLFQKHTGLNPNEYRKLFK